MARFDHAFAPNQSPRDALVLGNILTKSCFDVCSRLSVKRRDRQTAHISKTRALIAEYIEDAENDAVILDNGRSGDLVAMVRIHTGRTAVPNPERPVQLLSYVIIPLDYCRLFDLIDSVCEMALSLRTVSGVVTVEESFGRAQSFALSTLSDRSNDLADGIVTEERLKERAAHYFLSEQLPIKIAAPEWGLFLSTEHLKVLPLSQLEKASIFSAVRALSSELAFIQMTENPRDALAPQFNLELSKAREALHPILMDASHLPDAAWK